MEKELQQIKSQQHDAKHAELSRSDDSKIPELQGDDGKHRKTQTNSLLNAATGTTSTSATKEETKTRYVNTNMTKLFDKPFIPKTQKDIFIPPQVNTYKESLGQHKQTYNHITRTYIENIHKIQTFLNQNPRSTNTKNPHEDYITQNLQGYNKLIAQPGTKGGNGTGRYRYRFRSVLVRYRFCLGSGPFRLYPVIDRSGRGNGTETGIYRSVPIQLVPVPSRSGSGPVRC
ncbi:hypothetical protein H5410_040933 [Solanum commersonii]|uniref:Uncharacterized protein n=1 Tax=Solanum commersonii TaxID=4109 RepID=A0A9J5XQ68_SOLCO|nr:hypothetical protein H5410_040933 [Solanum commersonii]